MSKRKLQPNFLDMIPIRKVVEFTREGEKITLLLPKFRSEWISKRLIPKNRSKHFRIHLDELGSKVWDLIDGKKNTHEICTLLSESLPGQDNPDNPIMMRVTEFLRQLYKNRFIVFK